MIKRFEEIIAWQIELASEVSSCYTISIESLIKGAKFK